MSEEDSFQARRDAAKSKIDHLDEYTGPDSTKREAFFETVYDLAGGDAAAVPWADLAAKESLANWLSASSSHEGSAIDIGCGLGDNAEALAEAGYATKAFDFSKKAIDWAKKRFPDSPVEYHQADLFDMPKDWIEAFDLVHECYTLQSIPPETLKKSIPATASLIAPGGTLLVYSRIRADGAEVQGPPWPLEESALMAFESHGLTLLSRKDFKLVRPDKHIPHAFCVWRRN